MYTLDNILRIIVLAFAACSLAACDPNSNCVGDSCKQSTTCVGDACIELIRGFYSKDTCTDGTYECIYASVYFSYKVNKLNVIGLVPSNIKMVIDGRDVRNEGAEKLTQSNGLVVDLLLDTSYSLTQTGSADAVRASATAFIDSLPDSGYVTIAKFASEEVVPIFLNRTGGVTTTSTSSGDIVRKSVALDILKSYKAYESPKSEAQTKLYDAVGRLAGFTPESAELKKMQPVMVVFTDGQDTASTNYRTATSVQGRIAKANPDMRVYAIGMGDDIDENALKTISSNRFYRAASKTSLRAAFDSVSSEITSIYLFKTLVATAVEDAPAVLTVTYKGKTVKANLSLSSIE